MVRRKASCRRARAIVLRRKLRRALLLLVRATTLTRAGPGWFSLAAVVLGIVYFSKMVSMWLDPCGWWLTDRRHHDDGSDRADSYDDGLIVAIAM